MSFHSAVVLCITAIEGGREMSKKKCPHCKREIDSVFYTEWGQKVWNGREWEDDEGFGNSEFRCSECNASLDGDDLTELGVL